jgi:hypothetical protein
VNKQSITVFTVLEGCKLHWSLWLFLGQCSAPLVLASFVELFLVLALIWKRKKKNQKKKREAEGRRQKPARRQTQWHQQTHLLCTTFFIRQEEVLENTIWMGINSHNCANKFTSKADKTFMDTQGSATKQTLLNQVAEKL